jgi:hypothetical protein
MSGSGASVLFSSATCSAPMSQLPDDVYTESEMQIIGEAFMPTAAVMRQFPVHMALISNVTRDLHLLSAELRLLDDSFRDALRNMHMSTQLTVGAHTETQRLMDMQQSYLMLMKNYTAVLSLHVQTTRKRIYYTIAKVQLPERLAESQERRRQGELCDERCQIRCGLPGSPLHRQKCCGASVCSSCLLEHNFVHSRNAFYFHAPCFNCNALRGIFKHFDGASGGSLPPGLVVANHQNK